MTSCLEAHRLGSQLGQRLCLCPMRSSLRSAPRNARRGGLQTYAGLFGPGKKWESYELNHNQKVVRVPIHVKKGDTVQVITGRDKGKVGEVQKVLTKQGQVVVEGVNVKTKTVQPKMKDEKGTTVQTESPVHHSNVMLYSKEQKVRSRFGHKVIENGKKVRYLVKTGEVLD